MHVVKLSAQHGPRDNWLLQDVVLQPLQGLQGPAVGGPLFFHADTWLGGGAATSVTLSPSLLLFLWVWVLVLFWCWCIVLSEYRCPCWFPYTQSSQCIPP